MRRSAMHGIILWLALCLLILLAACDNSSGPADPIVAEGERLFKQNCTSCHSLRPDLTITGPSLSGIASRAGQRMTGLNAREYLLRSITAPGEFLVEGFSDLMQPDFEEKLSAEELDAVIAYLMTLE